MFLLIQDRESEIAVKNYGSDFILVNFATFADDIPQQVKSPEGNKFTVMAIQLSPNLGVAVIFRKKNISKLIEERYIYSRVQSNHCEKSPVGFLHEKSKFHDFWSHCTGKSVSEALILESVSPQYDERLFIELQEKYKFRTCCVQILL